MGQKDSAEVSVTDTRVAIRVSDVSKDFVLPHERVGSVKQLFVSALRRRKQSAAETQHALHGINFTVNEGEFFGIVGRNGSGKSTMLKILAGIYQPTTGGVHTQGKLVPFIELGVGFNPELTGRENVYLNGALLGFSKQEVVAMYDKIVAFAELERFMDQKLKNYSSGMQVRLAFSVAINAQADILLIDEVLAVGDADFQRKCFDYFKSLKKHKKTVIFVTHDMGAVREYCDRAILIDDSRLVAEGVPDDIAARYTRMFTEEVAEENPGVNQGEQGRWGDSVGIIQDVSLSKRVFSPADKQIVISVTVRANRDLNNPIFGFSVKDATDTSLLGTNTKIKHLRTGVIKAGKDCILQWTFPNILADGLHFVDVTLEYADGVTVYDWWTEAASFHVRKTEQTAYRITPQIEVNLSK